MQKQHIPVLLIYFFLTPLLLFSQPKIQLATHATGFTRPVDITHCGDSRLFIVEQRGLIWILDSLGNRLPDTFLNIDPRVRSTDNEQGLLGLAFPPDFAQTGEFYVNYTFEPDGDTRVSRFRLKAGNPNQADPASEEILLTQDQPYTNHNGGCIKFGPDGYLYIALGDGGDGGDPHNNGQTKNTLLGKILRIDVNSTSPGLAYGIPGDNPFVNNPAYRPEIWSLGWRNPWRFSFDRLTGDMWIGDVGQSTREEIDFEPAGVGGRNYGWRCYEGTFSYNTSGCPPTSTFTGPVFDYDNNSLGCSITGGFIYRGNKHPDLFGLYLFPDFCSGRWWGIRQQPDSTFSTVLLADLTNFQYSTLGEDRDGELYVAALNQGTIYRINEQCSGFQISGTVTNAGCTGASDGAIELNIAGGSTPFEVDWSNGQTGTQVTGLVPGTYTVEVQDDIGCIRRDTFVVEATASVAAPVVSTLSWTAPLPTAGFLCSGDTVRLEASEAPAGFGYQWHRNGQIINGATGRQFAATQPGAYQVRFTDDPCNSDLSAATTLVTITITGPSIMADGPTVFCEGDSTVLTTGVAPAGFTLQWFRNGAPIAGANGTTLVVKTSGEYTLGYQRPNCNQGPSDPVTIAVETPGAGPGISASSWTAPLPAAGFLCPGDTIWLEASDAPSGYAYQWYRNGQPINGATLRQYASTQPGAYQAQFTGVPCHSALSATTVLSTGTIQGPSILVSGSTVLCEGDSALLTSAHTPAGFTLQWFRNGAPLAGADGATLTVKTSGVYTLEYQRPDCNQGPSSPVTIVEELLSDSVALVFTNDTLRVSQGTWPAYRWFRDGVEIAGATGPEYVPTQSGFYECRLTTSAGCTYLLGLQVEIVGTVLPASVAAFSLTPNPTSGYLLLRLELHQPERMTLSLTDMQQRTVFSQTHQGQRLEQQIDLRFLPAGSYYLTVQLESGLVGRRVVKN